MGCKATKTGLLMKWLVCASIYMYMYVLLFGVLNLNKLYLLAFFSSPVQSTGRAIVLTLASAFAFALALVLPLPSRHF